jgi:hypothetical protein
MLALGAAYLAALPAGAALLWLTTRLFGVRAGFGRAVALAALLALVNLAIVGVARGLGAPAAGLVVVLLAWPVLPAVTFRTVRRWSPRHLFLLTGARLRRRMVRGRRRPRLPCCAVPPRLNLPAHAPPDFAPWTTGLGSCILEALQRPLAERWPYRQSSCATAVLNFVFRSLGTPLSDPSGRARDVGTFLRCDFVGRQVALGDGHRLRIHPHA